MKNPFQVPELAHVRLTILLLFLNFSLYGTHFFGCTTGEMVYTLQHISDWPLGYTMWNTKISFYGLHLPIWPFLLLNLQLMIVPFFKFSRQLGPSFLWVVKCSTWISLLFFALFVYADMGFSPYISFQHRPNHFWIPVAILANLYLWHLWSRQKTEAGE
ncbi:MAG: hypothetical protein AAFV95_06510 [Bacteroidota bacterium]